MLTGAVIGPLAGAEPGCAAIACGAEGATEMTGGDVVVVKGDGEAAAGGPDGASVAAGSGDCGKGSGICGVEITGSGTCGVPTMVSCGAIPAVLTCNCSVVPAGSCWGNCAAITASPILSAVMPSGMRPITSASSTWPGLNNASSAAGRPVAP